GARDGWASSPRCSPLWSRCSPTRAPVRSSRRVARRPSPRSGPPSPAPSWACRGAEKPPTARRLPPPASLRNGLRSASPESREAALTILVTGSAGFIGFHLSRRLLERGEQVVGLDNLNAYYDPTLKAARLEILERHGAYRHAGLDLADRTGVAA